MPIHAVKLTTPTRIYTIQVPAGSEIVDGTLRFPCLEPRDPEFGDDVVLDESWLLEAAQKQLFPGLTVLGSRPLASHDGEPNLGHDAPGISGIGPIRE